MGHQIRGSGAAWGKSPGRKGEKGRRRRRPHLPRASTPLCARLKNKNPRLIDEEGCVNCLVYVMRTWRRLRESSLIRDSSAFVLPSLRSCRVIPSASLDLYEWSSIAEPKPNSLIRSKSTHSAASFLSSDPSSAAMQWTS